MQNFCAISAVALFPFMVAADLPVHCLRHQIVGDWEFTLSPTKSQRTSCGHERPDNQDKQPAFSLLAGMGPSTSFQLAVQDPDTVKTSQGESGTWTMIYDEGFEVEFGGKVFFAFSKFEMVADGKGGQTNVSHCDETFIGWYRDSARTQWGCYHGQKVGVHRDAAVAPAPHSTAPAEPKHQAKAALVSKASIFTVAAASTEDEETLGLVDDQEQGQQQAAAQDSAPATSAAPPAAEAQTVPAAVEDERAPPTSGSVPTATPDSEPLQAAFAQAKLEQEAADSSDAESGGGDEEAPTAGGEATAQQQASAAPPQPAAAQSAPQSLLAEAFNAFNTPASYEPWVPKSAGYDKPMPHHWQQAVAEALNFMQLGWTAEPYRMFTGKTPRELNRFAGTKRSRVPPQHKRPAAPQEAETKGEPLSFLMVKSEKHTHRKAHSLGESFDWRQVNGKSWLQPVVSQGDCGSCYAISTIHMLTARNRIKVKDTNEPAFSVTFPLRCSEYNQGCNGGYGFLESKWAEDVGLVPEQCSPFSDDSDAVCQALQDCDLGERRYRAVNHRYVGGFYGGSDHEHIRRELVTNGPLVLSFEPKEDFMYYKAGLYRSGSNKIHQEWEQVDHAVLLIGMGQESGQPYWTMQNSWGSEWGEQGYFRMARGIDESGCESIAVAADVEQDSSNQVLDDFLNSL